MNKQALKKHHFWILAGLAPLLTFVAVVLIWSDVGAEVEAKAAEVDAKLKDLGGARPKGEKVLADLEAQKTVLTGKRGEMWQSNWGMQQEKHRLFAWPVDTDARQRLRQLELKYTKFGEPMEDLNEGFEVFKRKEVYEEAYQQAANSVRPTYFPNRDWRTVFRHVTQWGEKKPNSNQIWLALEDFWLQRAMIQPINAINDGARLFRPVPVVGGAAPDQFKRSFESRVWRVDLEVPQTGPEASKVVRGKITNLTDRLQIFGIGNRLLLKIWLSDTPNAQPMTFPVGGQFVKAGETVEIKFDRVRHAIPPGMEVQQLARVERILDEWTVPVRQVLNMEMQFLDSRNAAAALKPPEWLPEVAAATSIPRGGDEESSGPSSELATGAAKTRPKSGTPRRVLDANRLRYFDLTQQVRRVPVTVVLLIDQMFMQDALVAYSNSPLRYQITQFHWSRYRKQIPAPQASAEGGFAGGSPEGEGSSESFTPPPGFAGSPLSDSESSYGSYGSGAAPAATVDAGQVTSGLVALTIYGIASLYEKLDAPPPPAEAPAPDGAPVAPVAAGPKE